jgi:retinol-binding protein 3
VPSASVDYRCFFFCIPGVHLVRQRFRIRQLGNVLHSWLDAFNRGDRAKMQAYLEAFDPRNSVERMLTFRNQTGGFDLLGIVRSEPKLIKFRVKERTSPLEAIGSIQLKDAQPPTVETFAVVALPPGAIVENVKFDGVARQRVLDGIATSLKEQYVYPVTAQKMDQALRDHAKHGDYDSITDGDAFAGLPTRQLQEISHDQQVALAGTRSKPGAEGKAAKGTGTL